MKGERCHAGWPDAAALNTMDTTLFLALLPLILISVGLELFALIDLIRRDRRAVQGGNKWIWALVILLISVVGPVAYLMAGRTELSGEE